MNIDQILSNCLGGLSYDKNRIITGEKVSNYVVHTYATFCDFHVDKSHKDAPTNFGDRLIDWGIKLEKRYVESLQPGLSKETYSYDQSGLARVLSDCINGKEYIFNPPLWFLSDDLAGRADLLVKDNSSDSHFGAWHYRVEEIKFTKDFKEKRKLRYVIQGVFYTYLLGQIQGYTPGIFSMVDRDGNRHEFNYGDYKNQLTEILEGIESIRDKAVLPEPELNKCKDAYWNEYANEQAIKNNDLTLLVGFTVKAKKQAKETGITSIGQFAKLTEEEVGAFYKKPNPATISFLCEHASALESGKPKIRATLPDDFAIHETYCFLDIEDSGTVHPQIPFFMYLIGVSIIKDGEIEYTPFTGMNEGDETGIVDQYLDFVSSLTKPIVFYWSPKEKSAFEKFFKLRYKGNQHSFDDFERSSYDMRPMVKETVALPIYSYSIKDVAKYLDFKWRQEDVDAMESMVLFWECYEQGIKDVNDDRMKRIILYNEDDCDAMVHVYDWLLKMSGEP